MSNIVIGLAFCLITSLIVIAGDTLVKLAADNGRSLTSPSMIAVYALYASAAVAWYGAMRHMDLGQGGVAFSMFTLLALCVIGAVAFDEPVHLREAAGIVCALAALVLMARVA